MSDKKPAGLGEHIWHLCHLSYEGVEAITARRIRSDVDLQSIRRVSNNSDRSKYTTSLKTVILMHH